MNNLKAIQIMFDLETLGNTPQAPIIQLGAIKFDLKGTILDTFIGDVDLKSLDKYNFAVDYNTLNWWFNQEDKAIKSIFSDELVKEPLKLVLFNFIAWIGKLNDYEYWSHATFDPPILINNLLQTGHNKAQLLPYRLFRDIRTITSLANYKKEFVTFEGIKHNALDDCKYQIKVITKCFKLLNIV
jgi:exodeoxyribonuclease VIII